MDAWANGSDSSGAIGDWHNVIEGGESVSTL